MRHLHSDWHRGHALWLGSLITVTFVIITVLSCPCFHAKDPRGWRPLRNGAGHCAHSCGSLSDPDEPRHVDLIHSSHQDPQPWASPASVRGGWGTHQGVEEPSWKPASSWSPRLGCWGAEGEILEGERSSSPTGWQGPAVPDPGWSPCR